ncbi:MAG: dethiobiotin synthase [Chitinophagaceae bacterium]
MPARSSSLTPPLESATDQRCVDCSSPGLIREWARRTWRSCCCGNCAKPGIGRGPTNLSVPGPNFPSTAPRWDDLERLASALARPCRREQIGPQRFLAPLAPPLAARQESRCVDWNQLDNGYTAWESDCDSLIVEGAGGWLCPLTEHHTFADWVVHKQLPILIVARRGLGTINHTLLTIAAIRQSRLPIVGVILNRSSVADDDVSVSDNAREIEARSGIPVLGEVLWQASELRHGSRVVRINWHLLMSDAAGNSVE